MSKNEDTVVVVEEGRRWEALSPDILAWIFVRIQPTDEMVRRVLFVCKPWMEVVAGPYCWRDINLLLWSQPRILDINDSGEVAVKPEVDPLVEKLVRRSSYTVQRISINRMGESGFLSVVNCGRCLISLVMPVCYVTDDMVLKHIKPLPNLKYLDISYCFHITHKGIAAFGNHCKSLIDFKRCMHPFSSSYRRPIDESEAKTIAHTMPNLQRIQFRYGKFGNSGVSEILSQCKSLTHLDIRGCWNVELDDDLAKICERLEHFQSPGFEYDVFYSFNSKDDTRLMSDNLDYYNEPYVDLPSPTSD